MRATSDVGRTAGTSSNDNMPACGRCLMVF
jgi:hypothetical protein